MEVSDLFDRLPLFVCQRGARGTEIACPRLSLLQSSEVGFHLVVLIVFALDIIVYARNLLHACQIRSPPSVCSVGRRVRPVPSAEYLLCYSAAGLPCT